MRPIGFTTLTKYEHIADISFTANTALNLPTEGGNLPRDRYYYGLLITVRGRATMPATGGPTALLADGPYSLVELVSIEGYHIGRAANERFFNVRGADLYRLVRLYQASPFEEYPTTWSFSANATNDFQFTLFVPFVPLGVSPLEQANYLLDAPMYNPLKLTIQWGDAVSVFNSATTYPTLSAYGSSTGSPVAEVGALFALGGASQFTGRTMGRVWRFYHEVTDSKVTTTANEVRLLDIPRGHYIRSLVLKTGTKATVTGSNNAYATLSDFLTDIKINRGTNNMIRWYRRPSVIRDTHRMFRNISPPTGFNPIDFAQTGLLAESLSTRGLVSGPSGSIDLYLTGNVSGASNQALLVLYEEVRQLPVFALRRR